MPETGQESNFNMFDREQVAELFDGVFVNWLEIEGEAASKQLKELSMWLAKFLRRYRVDLSVVPNCWQEHPVILDELTAVWRMWLLLMDPGDSGFGPIQFWEHWAMSQARLRNLHTCRADKHVPDREIVDRK